MKLWQGSTYNDDRLFILDLQVSKKHNNIVWAIVTRRNIQGFPPTRVDEFATKEEAVSFIHQIEPKTPLISLGGKPPIQLLSYVDYVATLREIGIPSSMEIYEQNKTSRGELIIESLSDPVGEEMERFSKQWHSFICQIPEPPDAFIKGVSQDPHEINGWNVNALFSVFDKLKIREGYVLDYVYAFDGRGGMPLLYARKEDEPSLHSLCEYYERFQVTKKGMVLGQEPSIEELSRYMSAIDFDDAPLGSLQYALFALTAGRFYLFWHALYNDRKFIFSRGDLLAILSSKRFPITDDDARKAGNLDEFSSVQLENGVWKVRLFNYEINTGFSYVELRVCAPNSILQKSEEIVIKGSSSILY